MSVKTQSITSKIQLVPVGDREEINRVYQYLRDGMYNQNKAYNILISHVYAAIYSGKSNEEINELYKLGGRNPKENDATYSLYQYGEIQFPKGLGISASITQMVKNDMKTGKSNGLFKGRVSLQNRKLDAPLRVESRFFQFYHNYSSYPEFLDKLMNSNVDIYMHFVNGITFKVVFGNPYKSHRMRCVFQNIFEGVYKVQGSSIQFDSTGKKILLNLCLAIPKKEPELNEERVVGAILGTEGPIVCALNEGDVKIVIGSQEALTHVKTKLVEQRRRLQKSLRFSQGGHGRKKKLQPLERLKKYEANFVKTQNHILSRKIVDFALEQKAKYINIDFSESNDVILNHWAVYQLEQFIAYKAGLLNIEVRKVDVSKMLSNDACEDSIPPERAFNKEDCNVLAKAVSYDYILSQHVAKAQEFIDS